MAKLLCVAKKFNDLYRADNNGTNMDQMRMHKMMYLVQRESLMYNKATLFDGEFEGWKYGPVLVDVRNEYLGKKLFSTVSDSLSSDDEKLVESVYQRYNGLSSWKLSTLSHGELSWKSSREGLAVGDNGDTVLKLADMRVDAARELLRRKKLKVTS